MLFQDFYEARKENQEICKKDFCELKLSCDFNQGMNVSSHKICRWSNTLNEDPVSAKNVIYFLKQFMRHKEIHGQFKRIDEADLNLEVSCSYFSDGDDSYEYRCKGDS